MRMPELRVPRAVSVLTPTVSGSASLRAFRAPKMLVPAPVPVLAGALRCDV